MLTAKDRQLVALLRLNAREPVASLARKLGLSRSTVQDRLKRLEDRKLILGYDVRLAEDAAAGIEAFVTIEAEPQKIAAVIRALKRFSEIDELHSVSGKYDLVALIRASNAAELDAVLDRIGETTGITGTESAVILSTKLERR